MNKCLHVSERERERERERGGEEESVWDRRNISQRGFFVCLQKRERKKDCACVRERERVGETFCFVKDSVGFVLNSDCVCQRDREGVCACERREMMMSICKWNKDGSDIGILDLVRRGRVVVVTSTVRVKCWKTFLTKIS